MLSFGTEDPHSSAAPGTHLPGTAQGHLCLLHHSLAGVFASTHKTQESRASKNSHLRCGSELPGHLLWDRPPTGSSSGEKRINKWHPNFLVSGWHPVFSIILSPREGLASKLDSSPFRLSSQQTLIVHFADSYTWGLILGITSLEFILGFRDLHWGLLINPAWDFPDGPVVKNQPANAGDGG